MNLAPRFNPHYRVTDYLQWAGDWELIDGVAVSLTPSASGPHQSFAFRIGFQFGVQLQHVSLEELVLAHELDWVIDEQNVVRPDFMIFPGPMPDGHVSNTPILICEVLSPSTSEKDRTVKFAMYEELGVRYYLLADPTTRGIDVYRLVDSQYQRLPNSSKYAFELNERHRIEVEFGS